MIFLEILFLEIIIIAFLFLFFQTPWKKNANTKPVHKKVAETSKDDYRKMKD